MTRTANVAIEASLSFIKGSNHMFSRAIIALALAFALAIPAQSLIAQDPPAAPAMDQENILHLDLSTGGRVTILLYPNVAPAHVERIKTLARRGFYNNIVFHRVIDGFMAQTGDPAPVPLTFPT
jgi:hypothetical protein